jgi:hypothetical protein
MRERIISCFLLVLLFAAVFSVGLVHNVKAGNMNVLYVGPSSQPSAVVGSSVTFQVKVSQMDPFNAWSIIVKADPAILNLVNFTITPNVLSANYSIQELELTHCVNGVGTGCDPTKGDGLGIIHSAVLPLGAPPQVSSITGSLLTISYVSLTGLGVSSISIIGQGLANGTPDPLAVIVVDGFYGSSPGFSVAVEPTSFTIAQGSSTSATVTVTSHNGFAGGVTFTGDQLLATLVNPPIVVLAPNATATAKLLISASDCMAPGGVITGIFAASGSLSYTSYLFATVTPSTHSDFCVDVLTRNGLTIRAGSSNSSTIGVTNKGVSTPASFVGAVSLSSYVLPQQTNGPTVTLNPTIVSLSISTNLAVSNLTVTVPSNAPTGLYTVVVNATSGSLTHFAIDLVTVLPAAAPTGPAPLFVESKLSWIHFLSFLRNGAVQSWTAHVSSSATMTQFVEIVIRGSAGSIPFSAVSPIAVLSAGSTMISFDTPIPGSFAGSNVCFTARIVYGIAPDALSQTSPSSKSGCFRVAPI